MYRILIDTVITIHFLWIVFLLFGALAGVRWKPVKYLHITGLLFAIMIQTSHSLCPLTLLESWLDTRGGLLNYSGSFIVHYLDKLVYLNAPGWLIVLLTWMLCGFNIYVYSKKPFTGKIKKLRDASAGS